MLYIRKYMYLNSNFVLIMISFILNSTRCEKNITNLQICIVHEIKIVSHLIHSFDSSGGLGWGKLNTQQNISIHPVKCVQCAWAWLVHVWEHRTAQYCNCITMRMHLFLSLLLSSLKIDLCYAILSTVTRNNTTFVVEMKWWRYFSAFVVHIRFENKHIA